MIVVDLTQKPRPRLENYLSCLKRGDLDFYYRYHKLRKKVVIYQEEIIL